MIVLVKVTFIDDADASKGIDIMTCSSIDCAKETLLDYLNKSFETNCRSLNEVVDSLSELEDCGMGDDGLSFYWWDNGQGESFQISRINEREVNTKFQRVGIFY